MMSLQSASPAAENALQPYTKRKSVLPKCWCQHFASEAVAIKRSNESWVRFLALNVPNDSQKVAKNSSKKIYIYIHVIVLFHFCPFQRFLDWGFDPLKETHHSVDFQETQEEQNWREISSFRPRESSHLRRVVGNWMVRAGSQSVASLSGEFLEVCGIDSLGGGFKYFLFSPLLGDNDPIWRIFFRWVETTNQFSFEGFSLNKWEVLRTFSSGCHGDFQKGSVMWFQKDLYKQHKEVDYFSLVEWNRLGGNWWKGM